MQHTIIVGDCLDWMGMQTNPVCDLVFCSPPYESARTYDIGFDLRGAAWVEWAYARYRESLRVCRGLVAWVVEGQTTRFRYSATPITLMHALHVDGVHLRKPPIYHRHGIPGSGGPDWLRNDYEFIVCATNGGKLPWSDNTAMGAACKYKRGGAMSNRNKDGSRKYVQHGSNGRPEITNPGNVITCTVGGGHMGSDIAHENEAPFPESLADFFVRSFCPPGGTVLDIFAGSGTTGAAAEKSGRNSILIDCRESQTELCRRRIAEAQQA